jgi:hypothetical protein
MVVESALEDLLELVEVDDSYKPIVQEEVEVILSLREAESGEDLGGQRDLALRGELELPERRGRIRHGELLGFLGAPDKLDTV